MAFSRFPAAKTAALAGAQPAEQMPGRLLSRLSMVLVTLSRISAAGKKAQPNLSRFSAEGPRAQPAEASAGLALRGGGWAPLGGAASVSNQLPRGI